MVVAGAPSAGDAAAPTPACSNDADARAVAGAAASSITGTGAAFYMGGSTSIEVANGALYMYSRAVTAGIDIPLNIYAIRSTDSGWDAWSGGAGKILAATNPSSAMIFNGQVNAYDAAVDIFASNPTVAAIRAGVVARTLKLQASASGTNLDVSGYGTSSTFGSRIVRLTVSAAGTGSDIGHADGTALVRIPNDTSVKPTVLSWSFS